MTCRPGYSVLRIGRACVARPYWTEGSVGPGQRRVRLMRIRDGWFGRQLGRFARNDKGAAALEFALVLPPLCLILVGMFEMSMLMFTQASMEGALREAARFGMTGSVSDPALRQTQILAIINKDTYNMLKDPTISFEI